MDCAARPLNGMYPSKVPQPCALGDLFREIQRVSWGSFFWGIELPDYLDLETAHKLRSREHHIASLADLRSFYSLAGMAIYQAETAVGVTGRDQDLIRCLRSAVIRRDIRTKNYPNMIHRDSDRDPSFDGHKERDAYDFTEVSVGRLSDTAIAALLEETTVDEARQALIVRRTPPPTERELLAAILQELQTAPKNIGSSVTPAILPAQPLPENTPLPPKERTVPASSADTQPPTPAIDSPADPSEEAPPTHEERRARRRTAGRPSSIRPLRKHVKDLRKAGFTHWQICQKLDADGVKLPPRCVWSGAGTWQNALRAHKTKVEKWLSRK